MISYDFPYDYADTYLDLYSVIYGIIKDQHVWLLDKSCAHRFRIDSVMNPPCLLSIRNIVTIPYIERLISSRNWPPLKLYNEIIAF